MLKTEVKDDDSYYSKLELIATGSLSSDIRQNHGIQHAIFYAFDNSWTSWALGEFAGYPVDLCIRISMISDDYSECVLLGTNEHNAATNVYGLRRIQNLLDTTNSKEFKIFAGFDGRRWDFIANMDSKKAVLYIKNSVNPMIIQRYLMPFVPETLKRRYIAGVIEKKNKAGRSDLRGVT